MRVQCKRFHLPFGLGSGNAREWRKSEEPEKRRSYPLFGGSSPGPVMWGESKGTQTRPTSLWRTV